jgi:hypothetical protein
MMRGGCLRSLGLFLLGAVSGALLVGHSGLAATQSSAAGAAPTVVRVPGLSR